MIVCLKFDPDAIFEFTHWFLHSFRKHKPFTSWQPEKLSPRRADAYLADLFIKLMGQNAVANTPVTLSRASRKLGDIVPPKRTISPRKFWDLCYALCIFFASERHNFICALFCQPISRGKNFNPHKNPALPSSGIHFFLWNFKEKTAIEKNRPD